MLFPDALWATGATRRALHSAGYWLGFLSNGIRVSPENQTSRLVKLVYDLLGDEAITAEIGELLRRRPGPVVADHAGAVLSTISWARDKLTRFEAQLRRPRSTREQLQSTIRAIQESVNQVRNPALRSHIEALRAIHRGP